MRWMLILGFLGFGWGRIDAAETILPVGEAPPALEFPHFPDRLHAFVWRNWTLVEPDRLAKVLDTSVAHVVAIAESMGLPTQPAIPREQKTRGYITVLRRNWHLIPYDQLLILLDRTPESLAHSLREDDFLFHKLGHLKPRCDRLRYTTPAAAAVARAARIREQVTDGLGAELVDLLPSRGNAGARVPGPRAGRSDPRVPPDSVRQMLATTESRFQFLEQFRQAERPPDPDPGQDPSRFGIRFIYSYIAVYGDPLLDPELDSFPDGLLGQLADLGVNGIWIHTVLRQLAPSTTFPEFGDGHTVRLANLRRLVARARRHGIGVYLYMNEPRSMPASFFASRRSMQGVQEGDYHALCTSAPEVLEWLSDALAYVFENVPDLAGVFTITASENLTHCASHHQHAVCPRCRERTAPEIITEVNTAIERGVHRGNPEAKVLVWDWGWQDGWAADIISNLPKSVWLMSVSEWSLPISRGGVPSVVGEYSISSVGPGPRARRHWELADQAGLKTVAKVQLNNTWELSAVPYLPVLDLVAAHCRALADADIDGFMLSWTLGGYPSPNLEIAHRFCRDPVPTPASVLDAIARDRFGPAGAADARLAWTAFSNAFREYPYHPAVVYRCPIQYGPANLFYASPTGYAATMVGMPYDDLNGWRGPYPADVFADQFDKVAAGWRSGLTALDRAVGKATPDQAAAARSELRFARAAWCHFQSTANQIRFTMARNALCDEKTRLEPADRIRQWAEIERITRAEIDIAKDLFFLALQDSRIGYEASNHYYYVPIDLVEKIINCRYVLDQWLPGSRDRDF